jgi:hypothetical protein
MHIGDVFLLFLFKYFEAGWLSEENFLENIKVIICSDCFFFGLCVYFYLL